MKLIKKIKSGNYYLLNKVTKKKTPLFVSWAITNKCNLCCNYCEISKIKKKEINTEDASNLVKQFHENNVQRISLIGGEPFLRKDLDILVNSLKQFNIHVTITTNGILVPKNIKIVKKVDLIKLSYDGPEEIHEKNRCKNSYQGFLKAIESLKKNNIKYVLNCTITKNNYDSIQKIMRFVIQNKTKIKFQPVSMTYAFDKDIKKLILSKKELELSGKNILSYKKRFPSLIINSKSGINYLFFNKRFFPNSCPAGNILCKITSEGNVYPCSIKQYFGKENNCIKQGFKNAFLNLETSPCANCLCSSTQELNQIYNFNIEAMINLLRVKF